MLPTVLNLFYLYASPLASISYEDCGSGSDSLQLLGSYIITRPAKQSTTPSTHRHTEHRHMELTSALAPAELTRPPQ